jgi:hypothetical protein
MKIPIHQFFQTTVVCETLYSIFEKSSDKVDVE